MEKKISRYLLLPLLFIFLVALSSEEATATTVVFNNVSAGNYDGTMNMTVNISGVVGIIDAGIANVTFYATGQDGVKITLGVATNNSDNQTMFELEYDTTGMPDQSYSFDAIATNNSDAISAGASATQVTGVVFDNADLTMTLEATASGYDATTKCLKDGALDFNIAQSSDEQINADPILYFKRNGHASGFSHSFTISRVAASNNFTTTSNVTVRSLILPQDKYDWWVQYQDTDTTFYNTTLGTIKIDCNAGGVPREIAESGKRASPNLGIALLIAAAAWFLLFKGKGSK